MVKKIAIFMLNIRSKDFCNFGRTSQGDVVGKVSAHYIALLIYTCFCAYTGSLHNKQKNPARNSKSSNVPNRPCTVVRALTSIFFLFFSSYMLVLIYLMTFLREKNIFPIQWGKLVHTEVREFFLQKLIFAVFSTVLGVFRP
jgi:hypothetical protein